MNLKKIQNIPNTPVGKLLNILRCFNGYSPLCLGVCFAITYKCNLNCEFCHQVEDKRTTFPDISIEDVETIEKNIREAYTFRPRIHLFGGEPTVNNDFIKILEHFSQKGYRISLTTNGIDINKYVEKLIRTKGFAEINISLNTLDFEKLLSVLKLFEGSDNGNRPYINIACPITNMNQASLIDIVKRFEDSCADCITFQHTILTDHYDMKADINSIKEGVEEIKKAKFKIPVLFFPDIKVKDIKNYYSDPEFPYNQNKCIAPWIAPFIQPNGDVIPCDELNMVMGNVKEDRLKDIWNNKKYRKFRDNIQRFGISHPVCKRCCHRSYY